MMMVLIRSFRTQAPDMAKVSVHY